MELFKNFQSEDLKHQHIRATPEVPRRVSVYDAIKVMTGNPNPRKTWLDMSQKHPEILSLVTYHKFPGQGQRDTPVLLEEHLVQFITQEPVDMETEPAATKFPGVRATPELQPRYSVYDVIEIATSAPNPYKTWLDTHRKHPEVMQHITFYQFPGRGQRSTPVMLEGYIPWLARKVLCVARLTLEEKKRKMKMLGCDMEDIELEMKEITEEEVCGDIARAFVAFQPMKQLSIGPYRIDLYLRKLKIAIECDENNHSAYDQLRESQRQKFIEEELGCTFVRFNPYAQGFSVGDPIAAIVDKLMK
ncbi:hypothetical protein WJX84_008560 [Apatococcus fuscideae]|uniref:DUF559 domain-containing protein n=1 Tax=Apatococcus fuscideae TaxID=2026836 RepID=A0AAW1T5M1_9CHLO